MSEPLRFSDNLRFAANEVADVLDAAERSGTERDYPEGTRVVILSDTLARKISTALRAAR